jgi:hypothetical protein
MEYVKRVGRKTFSAEVTHDERGDWAIVSGAYRATLPMNGPEADAWDALGKPSDPTAIPERIEAHLGEVARASGPLRKSEPRRVKYEPAHGRSVFVPLDGEEFAHVHPIGERALGATTDVISGTVRCDSPRHAGGRGLWFVIARPGSTYDKVPNYCDGAERVENMTPEEFAEQHRAWHRETYPVSPRVQLDAWIERNKHVAPPELSRAERAEIDLGLAIAKSER